jgi:hypothetical protein
MEESDPIDFLIDFAWANGADINTVNLAKDKLKEIRHNNNFDIVGWARLNKYGDLYNPHFSYNPYIDESYIIPLYANMEEYKQKHDKLSQ